MTLVNKKVGGIPNITVNRPDPIFPDKQLDMFDRSSDVKHAVRRLKEGKQVVIKAFYSNGLMLLKEISLHLKRTLPNKTFKRATRV